MTDAQKEELARIEEQRKRREEALLLLLLLLIGGASLYPDGTTRRNPRSVRARVIQAIGHGIDPATAIRDTILGNPRLHLPGVVGTLANAMGNTALAAMQHVLDAAGVESTGLPTIPEMAIYYATQARTVAQGIADSLIKLVGLATTEALGLGLDTQQVGKAVSDSFTRFGWTMLPPQSIAPESKGSPGWNVSNWATNIVLDAWKDGSGTGYKLPAVAKRLLSLTHVSVLDERTSKICRPRNGLTLKPGDDFWRWNYPALHARCRSCLIGNYIPQVISTDYPTVPPEPGWGAAPPGFLNAF